MYRFQLSSTRTVRFLFAVMGLLLALHLAVAFSHIVLHRPVAALTFLADMGQEANLPALFNVSLFLICAALCLVHGRMAPSELRTGWKWLAAVMAFLAIDEGSQIHEKLMPATQRLLGINGSIDWANGWFNFAWVIPYGIATFALVLVLGRWLLRLPAPLRKQLLLSGAVYVTGAVLLEMVGGKVLESLPPGNASTFPWIPCEAYGRSGACWAYMYPRFIAVYTLEEVCEMTGLILCIRALLLHFDERGITLAVTASAGK